MTMYRLIPAENRMELFRSRKFEDHHLEAELEKWLKNHLEVLTDGEPLLLIGSQINTPINGTLDILALDADGNVVVIELKRGKPPRDAIAQALEYTTWAAGQSHEQIVAQADRYLNPQTLTRRWAETFSPANSEADPTSPAEMPADLRLNERQRIILVVEGYDERITAVASYLRQTGIDFNLVTFRYYRIDSGEEMIDLEMSVGPDQDGVVTPARAGRPSPSTEDAILANWSPLLRDAYALFHERLVAFEPELLRIDPTNKNGITFRRQMPDKKNPVYLCTFEPGRGDGSRVTIGIRKPSLQDYFDVETAIVQIESDKPDAVKLSNKSKWATLWCEPSAEVVNQVAELIIRYILTPLANR